MFLTHLQLQDFRSYQAVGFALEPGVTVFVGANGQGKTNLLEAVEYVATLGSHRVATTAPLIRKGAEKALVRAKIRAGLNDSREVVADIELASQRANKAWLNRSPLRRARDVLGYLRVVMFSPADLDLVRGDPSERRRFIDELATARWPSLAGVRADYERVLKQRSSLLKTMGGPRRATAEMQATLDVWDESLARFASQVVRARLQTLDALAPLLEKAYADIAPTPDLARAAYHSRVEVDASLDADGIAERLLAALKERRREEVERGLTLVGPHRDDIALSLGDFPAKGYASHGESWSLACALKLASFALLRDDGVEPALLLDDIFAELDQTRRQRLADTALSAEQVLITAAVADDVPANLRGARFAVADGRVEPLTTQDGPLEPVGEAAARPADDKAGGQDAAAGGVAVEPGLPDGSDADAGGEDRVPQLHAEEGEASGAVGINWSTAGPLEGGDPS